MTLGRNGVLRYGHFGEFLEFFGDRMADLGLIDSKLGLYIKINVNKFKVHISKTVAKMAILWPKIGQRHFGAHASHGLVCKIPLLARRTRPSARATIGYLVYNPWP